MKKVSDVLLKIFAIGIMLVLLAGALSFVGYLVALFIGGDQATKICTFIFKEYIPWVVKLTSIFTAAGLVAMYLCKIKALTVNQQEETAKSTILERKNDSLDGKQELHEDD